MFEDLYAASESTFGEPSDGMIDFLDRYRVEPCRALDLGAGQGRNSLYLAKRHFQVTAVEPSNSGLTTLERHSASENLAVECLQADYLDCSAIGPFGLIVAITALEQFPQSKVHQVRDQILKHLSPGGWLYVVSFTVDDAGAVEGSCHRSECADYVEHYFEHGQMRDLFESDLSILECREYTKWDHTHGLPHLHGKVKLVARRRNASE